MTTKQLMRVQDLYHEGKTDSEISEEIGLSYAIVRNARLSLRLPAHPRRRSESKMAVYTVYNHHTSEYITEGNVREISAYLNLTIPTIRSYIARTNTHSGGNRYDIVRVSADDLE